MPHVRAPQALLGPRMKKPEGIPFNKFEELLGFDVNLIGLSHCAYEFDIEDHGQPWVRPLLPGCGAKHPNDCALAKQHAQIHRAPRRAQ
jgi:hypothetical protein